MSGKTEHPIIFSTDMVQALLKGRKTQTRRVFKPDPKMVANPFDASDIQCPYGKVGDLLWVRETFAKYSNEVDGDYAYKADMNKIAEIGREEYVKKGLITSWKPSIHMPKDVARIWLKVVGVRVEQLQDITDEDAKAEGVKRMVNGSSPDFYVYHNYLTGKTMGNDPIHSFLTLWESINGYKEGCTWDDNPWVWVVEFEVVSTTGKPIEN